MLRAFFSDQCTASNSASTLAMSIRASIGSQAFMSLTWLVLACYRKACAMDGKRRERAPRAVAWVASGDSCGRPGGFCAFLACEKMRSRAPQLLGVLGDTLI